MDDNTKTQDTVGVAPGNRSITSEHVEVIEKPRTHNHDGALDFLGGIDDGFEYTAEEEKKLVRKLDFTLLPMMAITYMLNFLDKGVLSNASVFGLIPDLHLVGSQYSWVGSIFYFGYLIFTWPNSIIMQKVPIGRWLGTMVFFWGIVSLTAAPCKDFAGIMVNRFFLGVFEATNTPIFAIIVGQYYTRDEQPLRACIWWSCAGIAGFFGDSMALKMGETHGALATWQYLFLILGSISSLWGIVLFFIFPNAPMNAWYLSDRERRIATKRVLKNHTGIENRTYKWYQVRETFKDPQTYFFFIIAFLQCIPSGGLNTFNKLILTGLGYTNERSTIIAMPEHAIQFLSVIFAGFTAGYFKKFRCLTIVCSSIVFTVGAACVFALPTSAKIGRLLGVYALLTNTIPYIICVSMISTNVAGYTKKITVSVVLFVGYCVGQIIAPQFFISSEAPRYPTGFRAFYVSSSLIIVDALAMMAYYIWENRRRDKLCEANDDTIMDSDFLDLTDKEQLGFRYLW